MVTAAAVIGLALVGQVAFGIAAAADGGTLMGWAAILTAILTGTAAVIASFGTRRGQRETSTKADDIAAAVGPPNGRNIQQMVGRVEQLANDTHSAAERIESVDTYLHQRMHDVLNQLGVLVATQPTQIRLIESLIDHLSPKED